MAFERLEVAIPVQQMVTVLDAVGRYGEVSEGSDGDATPSERCV